MVHSQTSKNRQCYPLLELRNFVFSFCHEVHTKLRGVHIRKKGCAVGDIAIGRWFKSDWRRQQTVQKDSLFS